MLHGRCHEVENIFFCCFVIQLEVNHLINSYYLLYKAMNTSLLFQSYRKIFTEQCILTSDVHAMLCMHEVALSISLS